MSKPQEPEAPKPIVLCGKSTVIATAVIASLKPEYEGTVHPNNTPICSSNLLTPVIHVILSPRAGVSEIQALLKGESPTISDSEQLGSKNYSKPAIAVVTGAGYDDAAVAEMREACKGTRHVPWLRPDLEKPAPPLGPGYGEAMVERVKVCLKELAADGKLGEDRVYFY